MQTLRILTVNIHKGFSLGNRHFVLHRLRDAIRSTHADVVFLLYRDEMYHPDDENAKNKCEIAIGKQRNGPSGETVSVAFLKEFYRFEDLTQEDMSMMEEEI